MRHIFTDEGKIQSIVGTFLYYGQAIDGFILPTLNEISTNQAKLTENTTKECKMLMDYFAMYPNAILCFFTSYMQLHVDSDAAYLVLNGARSHIA
eukprot:11200827-Ditylum_brightwellii.AAC.1